MIIDNEFESLDDKVTMSSNMTQLRDFILSISDLIIDDIKYKKENLLSYFDEVGLLDKNNSCAIVDIGYAGTTQKAIYDLINKRVDGYYLITRYAAMELVQDGFYVDAYLDSFVDHQEHGDSRYFAYTSMIEYLFSSLEPSLRRFDKIDGNIIPVFVETDRVEERNRVLHLSQIHQGAKDFIYEYQKRFGLDINRFHFPSYHMSKTLYNFLHYPSWQDANNFAGIKFEDLFGGHDSRFLIQPIDLMAGLQKADINVDFYKRSDWKEGSFSLMKRREALVSRKSGNKALPRNKTNPPSISSNEVVSPVKNSLWKSRYKRFKNNPKRLFLNSKYKLANKIGKVIWL